MATGIKVLVPGQEKTSGACKIVQAVAQPLQDDVPEPCRRSLCWGSPPKAGKGLLSAAHSSTNSMLNTAAEIQCRNSESNLPELWGSSGCTCCAACEMDLRQLTPKKDYADCSPYICPGLEQGL